MSKEALKIIEKAMKTLGINYSFMEWKGEPKYPYFVGEYQEIPIIYETGQQDTTFILTGFTRGTWLQLEEKKEKIKNYFDIVSGKTVIAEDGSAVAIFYANSLPIHTGDADLKKIQINLDIKEWRVK